MDIQLKKIVLVTLAVIISIVTKAQLTGTTSVSTATSYTYIYTGTAVLPGWQTSTNGTITNSYTTGTGYEAVVVWNTVGNGWIKFKDGGITLANLNVVITAGCTIPATPSPVSAAREEPGIVNLTSNIGTNGTTNRWYNVQTGGSPISTSQNYSPSISVTSPFWVSSYNSTSGCESARVAVTATVYPKPVIQTSGTVMNMGSTISITVSNNTYTTYSWLLNDLPVAATSTLVADKPGTYTVSVTKTGMTGTGTSAAVMLTRAIDNQAAKNMVIVNQVMQEGVTTEQAIETLETGKRLRTITYLGGLGNTLQTIVSQASPQKLDLIQPKAYDIQGRQLNQYLPYVSQADDSKYRTQALDNSGYTGSEQYSYYQQTTNKISTDTKPYTVTEIESSPLGRIKSQTGVGESWHVAGKKVQQEYLLNRSTDNIRLWRVNSAGMPVSTGVFGNYQLYFLQTTDENGNKVKIYRDKTGRTILKSTEGAANVWLNTYAIYNDLGQLAYSLTPEGVQRLPNFTPTQAFLDQWAFQYRYDAAGRLVEYKTPDGGWIYTVYDKLDRVVLTQNADLQSRSEWAFVKYDAGSRPVLTGMKVIASSTRTTVQASVDAQINQFELVLSNATGYTLDRTYPTVAETDLLSVSYYDNYAFLGYTGWDAENHNFALVQEQGITAYSAGVAGLPTGGKLRILNSTTWLNAVQYYDVWYRPIQSLSENQFSGLDRSTLKYNTLRQVTETKETHAGLETVTVLRKYTYDHVGRLTKIHQNINSAPADQLVVQYDYNSLGQLTDKKLHNTSGTSFLQSVDYRYTIRGWLKSVNNAQLNVDNSNDETNDYFGMELVHEKAESGLGNTQNYSGNISAVKYKGPGAQGGASGQKSFKLTYDKSDRLLTATSQTHTGTGWTGEAGAQNETMSYDRNGNINTLQRSRRKHQLSGITSSYIAETMDNLTYTYASANRLTKVEDATGITDGFNNGSATTTEYTYNTDGALLTDLNKGISGTTYNKLGKPSVVNFTDGRKLEYTYNAAGIKLKMKTYAAGGVLQTTTDYVNGFVYENSTLSFFGSPEGRVVKSGSSFEYQYAIADHQGNTRVVFSSVTPALIAPLASFEGDASDKSSEYLNVNNVITSTAANHTAGGSKVVRMNQNNKTGPAKSLKVYPGDVVDAEVWAYYESSSGYGTSSPATSVIISAVASVFGGVSGAGGESGAIFSGVSSSYTAFGLPGNQGDNTPAAYLNYILFDKQYKVLDMGWQAVTTASNWNKAKISFTPVSIKEAGYMYIYLSYENESNNYVYFDDMKVTHTRSNVIQYNEYYPFGLLTSNSWTRESNTGNNFLYNGPTETNTTTGLIETFFRGYDPVLGRFMQVDPLAHYASSLNPYQYANNNSVRYNDPTGLFVWADVVTLWNNTPANGFSSWTDGQTPHYYEPAGGDGGGYTEVGGEGSSYNGGPGGYVQIGKSGNNLSIYTTTVQPAIYNSSGERLQDQINSMDYVEISLPQVETNGNWPGSQGDFIYDNNNAFGLGLSILEPSISGSADDAARLGTFTKGAVNTAKGLGYGLTVVNVGLSAYTITNEVKNGSFNTHSVVNGFVTTIGVGLAVTGAAITSPVWGTGLLIGGAVLGVGYGIAQVAGFDSWIDNKTNNWGKSLIK